MSKAEIRNLKGRIEDAAALGAAELDEAAMLVRRVFARMPEPAGAGDLVGQVLHAVDLCLPGWSIQLTGKASEPDGHWRCSLRETRGSDEIEGIGLGSGPTVEVALILALLDVAEEKAAV